MTLRRFVATGLALAMAALLVSGPAMAAGKPAPTAKVNINTASVAAWLMAASLAGLRVRRGPELSPSYRALGFAVVRARIRASWPGT